MQQHARRSFLLSSLVAVGVAVIATEAVAEGEEPGRLKIVRLPTGLQYSDELVGSGRAVTLPENSPDDGSDRADAESSSVVLMHLRASLLDGSALFDSRVDGDGRPMLFRLGSVPDDLYFLGRRNPLERGIVTLGVQDAILAQGDGSSPMRLGGVRRAVVPSELAYGAGGVSRYEAYKIGLRGAVPRDEGVRYEIELLRCSFAEVPRSGEKAAGGEPTRALACCPEKQYPCKI